MRWKFIDKARQHAGPAIWACYPHTSKWDAALALAAGWRNGTPQLALVKAQEFGGVKGLVLRAMSCIPVDPDGDSNTLDRVLIHWSARHDRSIVICPEGRLEGVPHWRTGFYILSLVTGVPVTYCWMDYRQRIMVREAPVWMTGDPSRDLALARDLLKDACGLYPAKASPICFREDWFIDIERLERQRNMWRRISFSGSGRPLVPR